METENITFTSMRNRLYTGSEKDFQFVSFLERKRSIKSPFSVGMAVARQSAAGLFAVFFTLFININNQAFAETSKSEIQNILGALARQPRVAKSRSSNVFHGRFRTRTVSQETSTGEHMGVNRLDSDGSLERIGGGSWSFSWSGNASYRDGNTYTSAIDYKSVQPTLYKVLLTKKILTGGFWRFGRFLPTELPSLGFVDGAQVEVEVNNAVRWGGVVGSKPNRKNLEWARMESFASSYLGVETGKRSELYYNGTIGVSQSLWKGKSDELALLWDQRADLSSKLNMYSQSQFDFNEGSSKVKPGNRLKRVDAGVNAPLCQYFSLRAGANFFERPDSAAERFITGENNLTSFSDSYWRYSGGSSQYLFWNLKLDEDLTYIRSSTTTLKDQKLWRYTLTRRGLWFSPQGSLSATVFDLNQIEGNGYGGLLSGFFPLMFNRLTLDLSIGGRYGALDVGEKKTWKANMYSGRLNAKISKKFDIYAGATQITQRGFHSNTIDGGLSYHW